MEKRNTEIELVPAEQVSVYEANVKLPDPETYMFWKNAEERRIFIDVSVDEDILEYERMILRWNIDDKGLPIEERKPIWIYLFNYGGHADLMWSMVDVIALSKTPIYTVNMGQCDSAAAIIFISGHKRFMLPTAVVMIHEGAGSFEGEATKVMDQMESYKITLERMKKYILTRTNIPSRTLNKKRSNDWEIDANYCLEHHVCDVIVESLDNII